MPLELHTDQPNVNEVRLSPRLGLAIVLTGAGSGLAGGLLMRLLRVVQHAAYGYGSGDFLEGVADASGQRRVEMLLLAGVLGGLVLWAMHRVWPKPHTSLTGAIWCRSGQLDAGPTLVDALLSIVTVGLGVALGREGALKDTGGVVAKLLSDWAKLAPAERRLLAACGAGAGMAAAYNVPLGGALFAAEVLLGSLTLATVVPTFMASVAGVAVSWLLLPNGPAYTVPQLGTSWSLVFWSVLAGPLLGLISVGYVQAVSWSHAHRPQGVWRVLLPVLVCAGLGLAAVRFPQLLGNGKNIVQLTFFDQMGGALLCWLIVLRPLASVLCLRAGLPGGLFTPTMTFGALLGDALGTVMNRFGAGNEIASYALIGSAAFLAAATLGPLSSAVFLLELTRRADSLMVPLLIATAGATIVARRLEVRSIYATQVTSLPELAYRP